MEITESNTSLSAVDRATLPQKNDPERGTAKQDRIAALNDYVDKVLMPVVTKGHL
jgi:hypothetical protein